MGMIAFRLAVEHRRKSFKINGRLFFLRYETGAFQYGMEYNEEYVFMWPEKGYVPCGWFRIMKLLEELEGE